jgi:hypothetical protein
MQRHLSTLVLNVEVGLDPFILILVPVAFARDLERWQVPELGRFVQAQARPIR